MYQDNYIKLASAEVLKTKYRQKEMEKVDAEEELQVMLDQLNTNQQENRRLLGQIGPSDPLCTDTLHRARFNKASMVLTTQLIRQRQDILVVLTRECELLYSKI